MADGSIDIEIKLDDKKAASSAKKTGNEIGKGVESGLKNAGKSVDAVEKNIEKPLKNAAKSAKSSFTDVASAAKSSFSDVGDAAKTAAGDASSAFESVPSDAKGSFADVSSEAQSGFSGVSDAAGSAAGDASSAFEGIPADAAGSFSDVSSEAQNGFSGVADAAQSASSDAASSFNGIQDAARQAGDDVNEAFSVKTVAAGNIAADAVGALASKLGEIGKNAIDAGTQFDKSMSQVAATMGITTDEIGDLTDFAKEMGAATAFSASQASEALNYMALAGYDAETSMSMLPTVLNLAAAGDMELAEASDMVTDAQSALGLSLDETSQMVDKMAKASSKSNTSVAQLGSAFLTVGGTAKNLKGGTTELATSLGILADNGIKGAEGGTALRNIILSLSAPTDKAADAINMLGVSVFDSAGNLRSLDDIFNDLNGSLSKMTQGEQTQVLNNIFNKVDLKSVNALLSNTTNNLDTVADALTNTGISLEGFGFSAANGENVALEMGKVISRVFQETNGDVDAAVAKLQDEFIISYEDAKTLIEATAGSVSASSSRFKELTGYIDDAAGSAQKMADTQLDNLAGDMTLLESATEGLYIAISDKLSPYLRDMTQFATNKVMPALMEIVENFGNISPKILGAVAALAVMKAKTVIVKQLTSETGLAAKAAVNLGKDFATMTTKQKAAAVAMNATKVAAQGLKATMASVAPFLVMTAGIEAFIALSGAIEESKEKAETFSKATDGITKSMDSYSKAFNDTKASMDNAAKGADTVKASFADVRDAADEAITKTAELADSLNDSFSEVGTNNALVQTYADTIQDLTNKYDENGIKASLSASEQGELITAVEGLNKIMGTSYDVVDAQNGILNTNTDEIMKSADAWQKRALMEAQAAASSDIMKRMIENTTALNKAEDVLATTQDKLAQAEKNGVQDLTDYRLGVEQAQAEVDRLKGVQQGLEQEQKDLNKSVAELNNELNSSDDSLKSHISNMEGFGKALEDAEVDADDFAKKLSDIGVSTEDLTRVMGERGEEGIQQMIDAYKQGGDSLEKWFRDDFGVNLGDASRDATKSAADNIVDGFSGETLRIANAIEGVVGVSKQEFAKMADGAGVSGEQAIAALALAIADGSVTVESSAEEINAAVETKLSEMDGETPAGAVIEQIKKTFAARKGEAQTAAANVEQSAQGEFNRLDGQTPAANAVMKFAGAMRSKAGEARESGKHVASQAASGMQSENSNAGGWGSHLVQNMANGIRGGIDWIVGAANSVADVIRNILGHTVPKEGILREGGRGEAVWGEHLVQNVADGMTSNRAKRAIKEASREVAVDINDTLLAEMARIDPMAQIEESLAKGSAAFQMSAMASGTAPSYNTNNQTLNFNSPVSSPDEIARTMRMQQRYGLAGKNL